MQFGSRSAAVVLLCGSVACACDVGAVGDLCLCPDSQWPGQVAHIDSHPALLGPIGVIDVNIENFSFNPPNLQIPPRTMVRWTNLDPVNHTVTSSNGVFNSTGLFRGGPVFELVFDAIGDFPYFCLPHHSMQGRIVVVPEPAMCGLAGLLLLRRRR